MTADVGTNDQPRYDDDSNNNGNCCCARMRSEFSLAAFGDKDSNGKILDIDSSFNINTTNKLIIATKTIFTLIAFGIISFAWSSSEYPKFYLAFLTVWTLIFCICYLVASLSLSISTSRKQWLVNLAWIVLSIAAVYQLHIVPLYWILEYNTEKYDIDFTNIGHHGVAMVLVLFDGFVINRTPLRLKHFIAVFIYTLTFGAWALIHGFVVQHNPHNEDGSHALYSILDFESSPIAATIVLLLVMFISTPLVFLFLWYVSLHTRRYQSDMEQEGKKPSEENSADTKQSSIPFGDDTEANFEETSDVVDGSPSQNDQGEVFEA